MVKLRLHAVQLKLYVYALVILVLAACAGQPPAPAETAEDKTGQEVKEVIDTAKAADTSESAPSVSTPKEPELPTIQTIPRQELEEPTVALDPLTKPEEAVEPATPESPAVADVEPGPVTAPKPAEQTPVDTQDKAAMSAEPVTRPVEKPAIIVAPSAIVASPANQEKPEPVVKEAPAPKVEKPSDPNTFIVTVGPKSVPHPSMGKGHAMGFLINGVSGQQLVLERGKTYTFDIRTDPKHDVYLSRKEIGWGASPLTKGVTGAYTYKGKMTFTPTESTPDKVYYSCRNHPHMGALIQIVNPGQKGSVKMQTAKPASAVPAKTPSASQANVTESAVKQKIMFAEMMINSQGAKRVSASQNDEAKQLLENARSALKEGRQKAQRSAFPDALAKADESLKLMSEATRLVPSQEAMAELAENYKALLAEITDYQKSHKDNLERMQRAGSVPDEVRYDEAKVSAMMSEAKTLAGKNNYVRANAILGEVQKSITLALHKMLDSQTIVYDLNFETAEDEYEYEYKRFISYEELIPIAIEAKKPAPGAVKLMESFVEKARKRRDQAVAKAKAGEYPDAIAMLQQATKTVRRALRMVGVMQ